ncbi:flagellar hook-associated protein FlgL [Bordetella sp. FB-8]|uniref:flagellar hook-associated protein FlgL n=1 Tax=Bordetella sp. FB-8 TaxID=1159870 RepID=UPI0005277A28|nr:flagellar hook-associated protein FlgL [Bordetella sp. FB-8]
MVTRISTSQFYQNSLNGILNQQSELTQVQSQLSSGLAVQTPSDNPLAAAQAVVLSQDATMNSTFASNQDQVTNSLGAEENALNSVTTTMQSVLQNVIAAGDSTLGDSNRQSIVTALTNLRSQLVSLANTTDSNGQYVFSGYQGATQPYQLNSATGVVTYQGDQGQRNIQVSQSLQVAGSDVGTDVFNRVTPGTQAYITQAGSSNTGTGIFVPASVSVPSSTNNVGKNFTVTFSAGTGANAGQLGYTVSMIDPGNPSGPATTTSWQAYTSGATISMPGGGVSFSVSGAPQAGDTFTLDTPKNGVGSNMDMFQTLNNLINVLSVPSNNNAVAAAAITNSLASANKQIQLNYDNVQTVITSIGARMNEVDALGNTGTQLGLSDTQQLGNLLDVNMYSATSSLQLRQVALQAAIQSFSVVQNANLFSMNAG